MIMNKTAPIAKNATKDKMRSQWWAKFVLKVSLVGIFLMLTVIIIAYVLVGLTEISFRVCVKNREPILRRWQELNLKRKF